MANEMWWKLFIKYSKTIRIRCGRMTKKPSMRVNDFSGTWIHLLHWISINNIKITKKKKNIHWKRRVPNDLSIDCCRLANFRYESKQKVYFLWTYIAYIFHCLRSLEVSGVRDMNRIGNDPWQQWPLSHVLYLNAIVPYRRNTWTHMLNARHVWLI